MQAVIGLVCIVDAAPMVLGIVGRNRFFGIRATEALVSDDNWREINAFGRRRPALFGVFLLAVSDLLRNSVPPPTSAWSPLIFIAPLTPLALIIRSIRRFAASLPTARCIEHELRGQVRFRTWGRPVSTSHRLV